MALTTVPGVLLNPTANYDFGNANVSNAFSSNTVQHSGLIFTDGQNIDQLTTFTRTLTLSTDWQDVGIKAGDLVSGTYAIQLYANDISAGGTNNNEYYSGTLSWFSGVTDSPVALPTDEIPLHRAGGSIEGGLGIRTFRSPSANPDHLRLQIYSNYNATGASNYVFKFRRLI
jgi:hypothetical protein